MSRPVAFYTPLKSPHHRNPSGDRRMARSLIAALERRDHLVHLMSSFRSYDRAGDPARQERIKHIGLRIAKRLLDRCRSLPKEDRPAAWITYHVYHKSPDWLGPTVSRGLAIPYLIVEGSYAAKQAHGNHALGHEASAAAFREADMIFAMTGIDHKGLSPLVAPPASLRRLPPFLDPVPFQKAHASRELHRCHLASTFGLDPAMPWLLTVAMMRPDVKRASYRLLAEALEAIKGWAWQLLIVGDGESRSEVEAYFRSLGPSRVIFAGIQAGAELSACYAAADVYAWPAVNEAYGLALLEAQAAGLPVVAGREGGVADVMRDQVTGILVEPRDPVSIANAIARLLDRPDDRQKMARAAMAFIDNERTVDHAAALLDQGLRDAHMIKGMRLGTGNGLSPSSAAYIDHRLSGADDVISVDE